MSSRFLFSYLDIRYQKEKLSLRGLALILVCFILIGSCKGQLINYVSNPGFEQLDYPYKNYNGAKDWRPISGNKFCYYVFTTSLNYSIATAPYVSTGFQYPRSGENFILSTFYCDTSTCKYSLSRGYPRNQLRYTLKANVKYEAKYYIVNTNNCVVGINKYGMYFGDSTVDTITYCTMPLTYINPQIEYAGPVIKDTLAWVSISGTFTANGTEKYMLLGNFRTDSNTDTSIINPTYLPGLGTDIYIDDVSLIECDQPAYAGPDKSCMPGDSVFIGSPPDVGIDEISVWYKLPSSTPIATVAGLWVKPVVTTTYVVRQDLCGTIKWDTVVVYQDAVGLEKLRMMENVLQVFPVPATEALQLKISDEQLFKNFKSVVLSNTLGQMIRQEELIFNEGHAHIGLPGIAPGVYMLTLSDGMQSVHKRFVVDR
jgi:hypothetical protein